MTGEAAAPVAMAVEHRPHLTVDREGDAPALTLPGSTLRS
jgi:hypothetical protein